MEISSDVSHRFDTGELLYFGGALYRIRSSTRLGQHQVLLQLEGVSTPEAAQRLTGQLVTIPATAVPDLPEGEYFHFQVLGLRVRTGAGEELGVVTDILQTGSNDVYVVSSESGEILIPAIADVIQQVNLVDGTMVVKLMEGLR